MVFRIVHVPGKGDLTEFALEAGEFSLRWLVQYYDIPYPAVLDLLRSLILHSEPWKILGA